MLKRLKDFPLRSGTILRYPLLLLLFNIIMEILTRAISQERETKSIRIGKEEVEREDLQILICSPNLSTDLQSHLHNLTSLHRYIKSSSDQAYPEDIYISLSLPAFLTKPLTTQNISNTLCSLSDSSWPVTQARSPGASVASSLHLSHSTPHRACHLHTWNSSQIHLEVLEVFPEDDM